MNALPSLGGVIEPEHTTIGSILTAVSVIVMPAVTRLERRTGKELGSATEVADSKQTQSWANHAVAVLRGLTLKSRFGSAWADSIDTLAIAAFAIREGIEAWQGDTCATPIGMLLDDDDEEHDHDHEEHRG